MSWFDEYFRRLIREFDELRRRIEEEVFSAMADFTSNTLEPLYEVEETPDEIVVRVELPFVERKEDIRIHATEKRLVVEAKAVSEIRFEHHPLFLERSFDKYRLDINLPAPIDPQGARAVFRRKILVIRLPRRERVFDVKVE